MLPFYLIFKSEKSFCWNMYDVKLEITQIIKCKFKQKLILIYMKYTVLVTVIDPLFLRGISQFFK